MGGAFSGSSQRRAQIAIATQQQAELDKQRAIAEDQQANSLQDILQRDTNRLMRVYGNSALMGATKRGVVTR